MKDIIYTTQIELSLANSYNDLINSINQERLYFLNTNTKSLQSTIQHVEKLISNQEIYCFAMINNNIIGYCNVIKQPILYNSHVGTLGMGIIKEYRGQQIGTHMLQTCIQQAKTSLEKIELEVFASNTHAISLYKKFSFQEEGRKLKTRFIDGKYDDIVLMGLFVK